MMCFHWEIFRANGITFPFFLSRTMVKWRRDNAAADLASVSVFLAETGFTSSCNQRVINLKDWRLPIRLKSKTLVSYGSFKFHLLWPFYLSSSGLALFGCWRNLRILKGQPTEL